MFPGLVPAQSGWLSQSVCVTRPPLKDTRARASTTSRARSQLCGGSWPESGEENEADMSNEGKAQEDYIENRFQRENVI